MLKLIVLTDLHMVPRGTRIIGLDPYRRLASGIRHIATHHADADAVIVLGDLAHRGDVASYRRLVPLLRRLPQPVHLMLGNHDDRSSFRRVFPAVPLDPSGYAQQVIDLAGYRLVLLDTLDAPADGRPGSAAGRLCAMRRAWLDAALASAGRRRVLLFMHHPPGPTGFSGMDAVRLADGEDVFRLLHRYGNVAHIFAGHIHRTINGTWHGMPFSMFKSPVHQQPMAFASASASLSVDEPAAYGIVLAGEHGVVVHTDDYEISGPWLKRHCRGEVHRRSLSADDGGCRTDEQGARRRTSEAP